jgi:hypothetical protein
MKRTTVKKPRKKTGPYTVNGSLAMDVRQAALYTGFSKSAIRNRIFAGTIPYRKFARRIIFDGDKLGEWFQKLPGVSIEESIENTRAK